MKANPEHFQSVDKELSGLVANLVADGTHADDVSGPMMRQSIALLIAADGAKATAKHLRELARRIDDGEYHG